ncbi:DUF3047 domain-containing protein [bacterium]|nr:DUF3047 domain-containing protein [bacterium]NUN44321.1 DUF3047 domain-containing protein [bacterium]
MIFIVVWLLLAFWPMQKNLVVEDFESDALGGIPARWYNRDGTGRPNSYSADLRRGYQYEVLSEKPGNQFLRYNGYHAKHLAFHFVKDRHWSIKKYPVLTWRWRAWKLPIGANEALDEKNDAVLSVYVVFDKGNWVRPPQVIRYVWSSTLPIGTILTKSSGRQKIVVIASGNRDLGQWINVTRSISDDYQSLFGHAEVPDPISLLLLSDADDTQTWAIGDYDDFSIGSL